MKSGTLDRQNIARISLVNHPPQNHQHHHTTERSNPHHFDILPPHLTSQSHGSSSESHALVCCVIGSVHEQLYSFSAGKDLLDVLGHNVFDACQFVFGLCDGIDTVWIAVELCDEGAEGGGEGRIVGGDSFVF